ncbi:MAG: hypothetical protein AAGC49_06490 [Brevundimonas sp.]
METIVTVLAVLVIAAPLVVLALRTTRWDPLRRAPSAPSSADADARRAALDVAALNGRSAPARRASAVNGRPLGAAGRARVGQGDVRAKLAR